MAVMKPGILLVFLCAICVTLFATDASSELVWIDGNKYERTNGKTYRYDSSDERWEIKPGQIKIKFHVDASHSLRQELVSQLELLPRADSADVLGYFLYDYSLAKHPLTLLGDVMERTVVEDAYLNTYIKFFGYPEDPYYADHQWNLRQMSVDRAWAVSKGCSTVTIAIIDDGFDFTHEDLAASAWENPGEIPGDGLDNDADSLWFGQPLPDDVVGWDWVDYDNDPKPELDEERSDRHGTWVAGVCAASDNEVGIAGVAGGTTSRPGVRLVAVRGNCAFSVQRSLRYCLNKGVDIVNMSFQILPSEQDTAAVSTLIDSCWNEGILLFASSGNLGALPIPYPAVHPKVAAVGATDENNERWGYSRVGPSLELVAPSGGFRWTSPPDTVFVWSTDNYQYGADYNPTECACPAFDDRYWSVSAGTSFSSPEAAAVAALLLSYNPGLTNAQVRERLQESAVDLGPAGPDTTYGYGLVNAYRALTQWGTISEDMTWGPGATPDTVYVSGDLTIDTSATLTINKGTVVKVATDDNEKAGYDTTKVRIIVKGTLEIGSQGTGPVIFEAWTDSTTATDWNDILFVAGSQGINLKNLVIRNAERGIRAERAITLTDCTIEDCETGIVALADVDMPGTTIQDCTKWGIRIKGAATISRGTVDNCDIGVKNTVDGANSQIEDVTITNCDVGVENRAAFTMEDCTVSGGDEGIATYANIEVNNTTITGLSESAMDVYTGTATLDSDTLSNCATGIDHQWSGTASTVVCSNSYLHDFTNHAIALVANSDSLSLKSTIIEDATDGVKVTNGARAVIDSCTIRNTDTGVRIKQVPSVTVKNCLIESNTTNGIVCDNSFGSLITANTIQENPVGIFCDLGDPMIKNGNAIKDNDTGIKCDNEAEPRVECNTIADNDYGVTAINDANPDLGGTNSIGDNSITGSTYYHVSTLNPPVTLMAEDNWWGKATGPDPNKIFGPVDYTPWSSSVPPCSEPSGPSGSSPYAGPDIDDDEEPVVRLPRAFDLASGHPNPFNPTTTIRYDVPSPGGTVSIVIYNVIGQLVRRLVAGYQVPGYHRVTWDGKDDRGRLVASGVYLVRMTAGAFTKTEKAVLLK